MNELLTINFKGSVDETKSTFNLKPFKVATKGESFSSHLKTQIDKKDVKDVKEAKDVSEKSPVNKSNRQTKIKQRREKPVSNNKRIDSDDRNTDQVEAAGVKTSQDNVKELKDDYKNDSFDNSDDSDKDSINLSSEDNESTETLDVFLQDYINITEQGVLGSIEESGEDFATSEFIMPVEAEGFSDTELMDELSALDMDMDMDVSEDLDETKLEDMLDNMDELKLADNKEKPKPEVEQSKEGEQSDNPLLTDAQKTKPMEQNPELKVNEKDNRSKSVSSITEARDYSSNNVSMKVEAGRDVPKVAAVTAPPRIFTVDEHKFVITKFGDNKVEITLEPNGIGKLKIEVNNEKGVIHAFISATEQSGKDIIEKNINRIMEELAKEGINIGQFSVSLKERHDQSDDSNKSAYRDSNNIKESVKEDIAVPNRQRHSDGRLSIFI